MGWFNAARRSSITPEHLVDSAKLYDFYVNGFEDVTYDHRAHVHLPSAPTSSPTAAPAVHSAPTLLDLLNTGNVEPRDVDIAALEEQLFNHPDPYDLEETDRVDPALQVQVVRSSFRFDVAEFVRLEDPKLEALITNVDSQGPGASIEVLEATHLDTPLGNPGDWSVDSFLNGE